MERVHLDDYEGVILVKLRPGHKDSALGVIIKTLKRWQQRGDVVFALGGLAHDPRQIQTALKAFQRGSRPPSPVQGCHDLYALSHAMFYGAMPSGPPITHSHQEIP